MSFMVHSKYTVTVSNTAGPENAETGPVQLWGPPLPPPTSVYTHQATDGFNISWAEAEVADELGGSKFSKSFMISFPFFIEPVSPTNKQYLE